jgi:ComF family protein
MRPWECRRSRRAAPVPGNCTPLHRLVAADHYILLPIPFLNLFLDSLYPPRCSVCDRDLFRPSSGPPICRRCLGAFQPSAYLACFRCAEPLSGTPPSGAPDAEAALRCERCRVTPPPFTRSFAAMVLAAHPEPGLLRPAVPDLQRAIHRWKYAGDHRLGKAFAMLLRHRLESANAPTYDRAIPVPLHWSKLLRRGFNPPATLARALSPRFGRFSPGHLVRTRATSTQTRLERWQRMENVRDVFRVRGNRPLQGEWILLVDDVMTSTATTRSAADCLLSAGAQRVDVAVLARASRHHPRPVH